MLLQRFHLQDQTVPDLSPKVRHIPQSTPPNPHHETSRRPIQCTDVFIKPSSYIADRVDEDGYIISSGSRLDPESRYGDIPEVPEDRSVQQIIDQEHKYKRELWRLQKILRRGVTSDDPLPPFNRRHLLLLVKRLCGDLESSTSKLRRDMDIASVSQILEMATPVSHGLLCIAFADTLHELREFLRREMTRNGDNGTCFCQELHAERSLLPLHRLKYLKSLTCIQPQHREAITSALDGCYMAISSLHSQSFVAEIDSLLDFALNMDPPPSPYYSSVKDTNIYNDLALTDKCLETKEENIYEEIAPFTENKKKGFFHIRNIFKPNRDVSAQEEFVPLTPYTSKLKEIFA